MGARKQNRPSPTLETVRRELFSNSKDGAGQLHDEATESDTDVIDSERRAVNGIDSVNHTETMSHYESRTHDGQTTSEPTLSLCGLLGILVLIISLAFIAATFASPQHFEFRSVELKRTDGELYLHWQNNKKIYLLGLLGGIIMSAVFGVTCCCFSWTITYFDSLEPGHVPPTPLSPAKYRKQSGHTFHIAYVVSIFNGLAVFLYSLWHAVDSFLFV